jgi:hypothetical protein
MRSGNPIFENIVPPIPLVQRKYSKKFTTVPALTIPFWPKNSVSIASVTTEGIFWGDITVLAQALLNKGATISHRLSTHCNNNKTIATMKKDLFSRFFSRNNLPTSSVLRSPISQQLFLAGLRCPSDQLQFVAIPLSFGLKGTAIFTTRF